MSWWANTKFGVSAFNPQETMRVWLLWGKGQVGAYWGTILREIGYSSQTHDWCVCWDLRGSSIPLELTGDQGSGMRELASLIPCPLPSSTPLPPNKTMDYRFAPRSQMDQNYH